MSMTMRAALVLLLLWTARGLAAPPEGTVPLQVVDASGAVDTVAVDLILFDGEIALQSGDHAEAVRYFRLAFGAAPEYSDARRLLARALTMQVLNNELDPAAARQAAREAREHFLYTAARDADPSEATGALRLLASRFSDGGRPAPATEQGRIQSEAARAAFDENRFDEAAARLTDALRAEPENASFHRLRGDALLESGHPGDAARDYRRALELNPLDVRARRGLGLTLETIGEVEEALAALREAFLIDDEDTLTAEAIARILEARDPATLPPPDRSLLGRAFGALNRWDRAEALFGSAVGDSASLPDRKAYALSRYFQDRLEEAIPLLEGIHRDFPHDPETAYYLGASLLRRGRVDEGRAFLRGVLGLDPGNASALKLLGLSLSDEPGREAESIDLIRRAAEAGAEIEHLPCILGMLHQRNEDPDAAWNAYRDCIAESPNFPPALFGLGVIADDRGDDGQAILYFERHLAATRPTPAVLIRLGVAYIRAGRDADGFAALRTITEMDSAFAAPDGGPADNRRLLEMASFFLATVRSHDDAIFVGEKLLAMEPANPVYANNLAMAYADAGRDAGRAVALAEQAVAGDPRNPGNVDTLGWALAQLGRHEEAETKLLEALRRSEGTSPPEALSEIRYHLAVLYRMTGRQAESIALLQQALEHPPTPILEREMRRLLDEGGD